MEAGDVWGGVGGFEAEEKNDADINHMGAGNVSAGVAFVAGVDFGFDNAGFDGFNGLGDNLSGVAGNFDGFGSEGGGMQEEFDAAMNDLEAGDVWGGVGGFGTGEDGNVGGGVAGVFGLGDVGFDGFDGHGVGVSVDGVDGVAGGFDDFGTVGAGFDDVDTVSSVASKVCGGVGVGVFGGLAHGFNMDDQILPQAKSNAVPISPPVCYRDRDGIHIKTIDLPQTGQSVIDIDSLPAYAREIVNLITPPQQAGRRFIDVASLPTCYRDLDAVFVNNSLISKLTGLGDLEVESLSASNGDLDALYVPLPSPPVFFNMPEMQQPSKATSTKNHKRTRNDDVDEYLNAEEADLKANPAWVDIQLELMANGIRWKRARFDNLGDDFDEEVEIPVLSNMLAESNDGDLEVESAPNGDQNNGIQSKTPRFDNLGDDFDEEVGIPVESNMGAESNDGDLKVESAAKGDQGN
ncbi:hypothetical protein HDU76_009806, partial [Blyttiomyces sp. JEL0837]